MLAEEVEIAAGLRQRGERVWPTPTVCGNYNRKGASASSGDGLATAVMKWPTPQASDNRPRGTQASTARRIAIGKQVGLEAMVKWTTPTAHNAKETNAPSESDRNTARLAAQAGGSLNPDWVEWLMNWPITWSSLNAVNRKEFQRWQEASATALQESGQLRTMWWDRDPSQAPSGQQPDEQPEQELGDSLQQVPRNAARQPEVEGSHEGSDLPLLRDSLHLQAGEGENVQQGMREQAGLDEAQIVPRVASGVAARVDRLKAIGNGQVPLCAATAFKLLTETA